MTMLILIALAVAALVIAGVVLLLLKRRRSAQGPAQPRTVADLVRMRAEAAAVEAPEPRPADEADQASDVRAEEVAVEHEEPAADLPTEGVAVVDAVEPAAVEEEPTGRPAAASPAADTDADAGAPPAPRPATPGATEDTPWGRAARMHEGNGAVWAVAAVPAESDDAPTEDGDWSGWADWAEVDATEDDATSDDDQRHLTAGVAEPEFRPVGRLTAVPDVRPGEDDGEADTAEPVAAEPVAAEPAPVPAVAEAAASPADAEEVVEEPAAEVGQVAAELPAAEEVPVEVEESPAEVVAPVLAAPALDEPVDEAADEPVDQEAVAPAALAAPEPLPAPRPVPARPRRSPADAEAEQAAADLALLRTFGFADRGNTEPAQVVALTGACAPEPEPTGGVAQPVVFRVVGRDGTSVAGAGATLLDDRGREVTTATADAQGRGEVQAPRPGSYMLVATAADHQPGAVALTVADAPAEVEVQISRSASVSGTVYGEAGPIVGAHLTLVQDGEIVDTTVSDADGGYRIGELAAGEYGLSVTAAECEPAAALLQVPEQADLRHDVDLDPAGLPAERGAGGGDAFHAGDLLMSSP